MGTTFFRDRDLNIPDFIFEIKTLKEEFVKIKGIDVAEEYLSFNEIKVPKSFSGIELSVSFESRFNPDDKKSSTFLPIIQIYLMWKFLYLDLII